MMSQHMIQPDLIQSADLAYPQASQPFYDDQDTGEYKIYVYFPKKYQTSEMHELK